MSAATRPGASPARRCAHRVVLRFDERGSYADVAFRAEAERLGLPPRDRAFAQRLAYGTIQRRALLDHVLGGISARPVAALDAPVRAALRLGVYQLLYADAVPDRAAVDETVELVKASGGRGAASFANAVMRRASREARAVVAAVDASTPEGAALAESHPEWVVRSWWEALGPEEARALLARDNQPPESSLRVNALRAGPGEVRAELAALGIRAEPARLAPGAPLPEALVLREPFDVHGSEAFAQGRVMPQARSSMLVAHVAAPRPGERVLDLCAAPGAKATHLAALMEGRGEVCAVERNAARARGLEENARRLGAEGVVRVRIADAAEPQPGAPWDRVLLDPPCSDLGTLQARPDVRWRKTPATVEELAALQRRMLERAVEAVRPGGVLVYSTCTISPPENERQIAALLAGRDDLAADDLGAELPELAHPGDPRFLQVLPHRHGSDGFFIARLRRAA